MLRLTNSILKFHGDTVTGTANGKKALQIFSVEPEITVDLLRVHIPMLGINGAELVEPIWKLRPGRPPFYYSGYSGKEFLWPEIVRNVSYLAKPVIAFQLTQGIRKMLEKSTDAASMYSAGSTLNKWSKVTTGECALFHSPSPKFT